MSTSPLLPLQSSPPQSAPSASSGPLNAPASSQSSIGATHASLTASPSSSLQVGGRGIKRRADGVVYTAENKRIAVHYMFGSSTSRRLAVVERVKRLRVGKSTLYDWKKEFPEVWDPSKAPAAGTELAQQLAAIRARSDEDNITLFLTPNDHIAGLSTASSGGFSSAAHDSSFVRPDGLGPSAEPADTFGPLGPGRLPPELVEKLRRVEGQADMTQSEQDQVLAMQVDADVGEEATAFVEATVSQAVALQRDSLQASTNKLWDRPKRNFVMFWKSLEKIRSSASNPPLSRTSSAAPVAALPSSSSLPASSSTAATPSSDSAAPHTATTSLPAAANHHVIVTEQKLVTYLNCFVLHRNPRLGMEALWTEIKAVTNLWETQQLLGVNSYPNPRKGKLLKSYMKAIKKGRHALSVAVREDWWKHSLRDGYDATEYVLVSQWFLRQAGPPTTINHPSSSSTHHLPSSSTHHLVAARHSSPTDALPAVQHDDDSDSDSDNSMTSDSESESPGFLTRPSRLSSTRTGTGTNSGTGSSSSIAAPADNTSTSSITAHSATMRAKWASIALRSRFEFLMQHALMGRSEDLRNAILAATYTIMLPQSRPQPCQAFVVTLRSGKTNTESRNEWGVAARHRNVETCPVGALGLYLFERWHLLDLPTPSFSSRAAWYDDKLLVSEQSNDISWSDQAYLLRYAFEEVGVSSSKITHAMRSGGARFAHEAGCTEDSLRIHGRWCGDRLIERYLGGVSIQPVRALADFDLKGGDYWLPRALLEPNFELQRQVFPFVEQAEAEVQQRHKDGGQTDHAALNFLALLKWLRIVLLQDAVLLQPLYPQLPIWKSAPFTSSAFQEYSQSLKAAIDSTPAPSDVTINTLVPELGRALGGLQAVLSDISLKHATTSSVERQGSLVRSTVEDVAEDLKHFVTGLFGSIISRDRAQQALSFGMQHLAAASAELASTPNSAGLGGSTHVQDPSSKSPPHRESSLLQPQIALPDVAISPTQVASSALLLPHANLTGGTVSASLSAASPSSAPSLGTQRTAQAHESPQPHTSPALALSIAQLAPSVRTVADLVEEWRKGRDGRLALEARVESGDVTLERSTGSARKQLSRWRIVVGMVETLSQGRSEESVAAALDAKMKKEKMGLRALADKRGATKDRWIEELGLGLSGEGAASG